jgi:hypothetical protein
MTKIDEADVREKAIELIKNNIASHGYLTDLMIECPNNDVDSAIVMLLHSDRDNVIELLDAVFDEIIYAQPRFIEEARTFLENEKAADAQNDADYRREEMLMRDSGTN